jgi:hypothetical protein
MDLRRQLVVKNQRSARSLARPMETDRAGRSAGNHRNDEHHSRTSERDTEYESRHGREDQERRESFTNIRGMMNPLPGMYEHVNGIRQAIDCWILVETTKFRRRQCKRRFSSRRRHWEPSVLSTLRRLDQAAGAADAPRKPRSIDRVGWGSQEVSCDPLSPDHAGGAPAA